jgi:TPR repeat protein
MWTYPRARTLCTAFAVGCLLALGVVGGAAAGLLEEGEKAYQRCVDAVAADPGGDEPPQCKLGAMYYEGQGVQQDYGQAAAWFRMEVNHGDEKPATTQRLRTLADQGYAAAEDALGTLYFTGHGVPQDYLLAVAWYLKSANQGDPDAQNNLGALYEDGFGVPQDYTLAHMWFNLAGSHAVGSVRDLAASNRNRVAAKMTPAQIGEAQKMAREWVPK